jgi:CRISPR-associated protein Csa3
MRTYISPIGYDTRRVTRPVINTGLGSDDELLLVRPGEESDTGQADQAVADVRQLLHEIEPDCTIAVERVVTDSIEETIRNCCRILADVDHTRRLIVSLGGGARDIFLPLTVATLVYVRRIETTLFFSDLDSTVQEWELPNLTARVPDRTLETLDMLVQTGNWHSLSEITEKTDHSKTTVIRHVNDLEDAGVVEADTSQKAKRVRATFTSELLALARQSANPSEK